MSERKILVPRGMLDAALPYCNNQMHSALEAALLWLSENPIVPNVKQKQQLAKDAGYDPWHAGIVEWQRRMFFEPEPEHIGVETLDEFCSRHRTIGTAALEAYRLGKESR